MHPLHIPRQSDEAVDLMVADMQKMHGEKDPESGLIAYQTLHWIECKAYEHECDSAILHAVINVLRGRKSAEQQAAEQTIGIFRIFAARRKAQRMVRRTIRRIAYHCEDLEFIRLARKHRLMGRHDHVQLQLRQLREHYRHEKRPRTAT